MRIGIDAREICGKPTGVGRHLSGLLRAWSADAAATRHTFVLYAHEQIAFPLRHAELRVIPGSPGTMWEQRALPRAAKQDRLDVFFAPGYTAPLLLGTPIVVLVHDVSFAAHPEWFGWREGLRRRLLTRWSCEHARLVLTVSDAARREITSHFGLPDNRVRRIYPGVVRLGARDGSSDPDGAGARAQEPLVLFVGSVFNRRHVPDLIRAFKPIAMSRPDARLEIVGDNRTHPHENLTAIAAAAGIAPRVTVRPYVHGRRAGRAVSAGAGVRAAVRVRRLRPSAARGARIGRPAGARSTRTWHGRCVPTRRSTSPAATLPARPPRSTACCSMRMSGRACWLRRRRCWRAIHGSALPQTRWRRSRARHDGARDCHRQLQHQERSGKLPSVAARPSADRVARDCRRRQRVA